MRHLLVLLLLLPALVTAQLFNVTFLATNDVRGRILPINRFRSMCDPVFENPNWVLESPDSCFGGTDRRHGYIESVRTARGASNVVLVDSGNFWHGSLFQAKFGGAASRTHFVNLGYDIMGLGTSDFFLGPVGLASYVSSMPGSVVRVVSNIDVAGTALDGLVERYHVLTVNGHKVGVLGAVKDELSSLARVDDVVVDPDGIGTVQHVRTQLSLMLAEDPSIDVVVLVSSDTDANQLIAQSVFGIDIIFETGRVLREGDDYPQVVTNSLGQTVLLVSSGDFGTHIGDLQVSFDADGHLVAWEGDSFHLTNDTLGVASTWNIMVDQFEDLQALQSQVVARANGTELIYGERGDTQDPPNGCRYGDCPWGHLITDAMLDFCSDCDVGLMNGGAIRASVTPTADSNVTLGDVLSVLPFQNTFVTVTLRGNDLVQALQSGFTEVDEGAWPQLAGARVAWNPSRPGGSRVIDVQIRNRATGEYEQIDLLAFYKIGTNDFVLSGGDDYDILADNGINKNEFGPGLEAMVADYLGAQSPFSYRTQAELLPCNTEVVRLSVDVDGSTIWPRPKCRTLRSTGKVDVLSQCVSDEALCQSVAGTEIIEGVYVNASDCETCSGVGSCSQQVCTCTVPSSGPFAGAEMFTGSDCSIQRSEWQLTSGGEVVVTVASAIGLIVSLLNVAFFYHHRKNPVILGTSPLFSQLISLAGTMACVGALIITTATPSKASCGASLWIISLSFGLMFMVAFTKIYRVYVIFHSPQLHVLNLQAVTAKAIVVLLGIEAIILALFQAMAPLDKEIQLRNSDDRFDYYFQCENEDAGPFVVGLILYASFLLLWGVYTSYRIRNVPASFNEARAMALIVYHLCLMFAVAITLLSVVPDDPEARTLVLVVIVNYVVVFTLLCLSVPKFLAIHSAKGEKLSEGTMEREDTPEEEFGFSQPRKRRPSNSHAISAFGMVSEMSTTSAPRSLYDLMTIDTALEEVSHLEPARRKKRLLFLMERALKLVRDIGTEVESIPLNSRPVSPMPGFEEDAADDSAASSPASNPNAPLARVPSTGSLRGRSSRAATSRSAHISLPGMIEESGEARSRPDSRGSATAPPHDPRPGSISSTRPPVSVSSTAYRQVVQHDEPPEDSNAQDN